MKRLIIFLLIGSCLVIVVVWATLKNPGGLNLHDGAASTDATLGTFSSAADMDDYYGVRRIGASF